jgi:hypothetical protein
MLLCFDNILSRFRQSNNPNQSMKPTGLGKEMLVSAQR